MADSSPVKIGLLLPSTGVDSAQGTDATKGFELYLGKIGCRAGGREKMLDAATTLNDLRILPGNRLEELTKDRKGQHSIRINDQFRICFVWREDNAEQVEIVDYH